MNLSDRQFLSQFENQTLDPVFFHHTGHIRLCWLYLNLYDLNTTINKMCIGIQKYAESLGAPEKFHRTITEFLIRLIDFRIQQKNITTFEALLAENKDIVENASGMLKQYYTDTVLNSAMSTVEYVPPNIRNLK